MIRDIDMSQVSDGRLYRKNDMVRLLCDDCRGCSACCEHMDDHIVLDPYDICSIYKATGMDFKELLAKEYIAIALKDGLAYPYLKMNKADTCSFLIDHRCSIHANRPGLCRLFPLGRIYEDGDFSYFLQKDECGYKNRAKCRIEDWLGVEDLDSYEEYIRVWHAFHTYMVSKVNEYGDDVESRGKLISLFLEYFFIMAYDGDFYSIIKERINNIKKVI